MPPWPLPHPHRRGATGQRSAWRSDRPATGCSLAAALGAAMSQLALFLRTLEPPGPITALRPLQAELRDGPVIDPRLISMTDGLVGAIDTIAAILRNHIGSRATVPASSTGE